ncbi:MAG: PD-(D/E)XK nuclease family protein [Bacteroidota bacterium]
METFLENFISSQLQNNVNFQNSVHILPSRRAVNFFKEELGRQLKGSFIMPKICSIEEFIEEVSEAKIIDHTAAVFEFYSVYQNHTDPKKQEAFEIVYNWAQTVVQDFNEIDRYLIDADQFFGNLKAIKEVEHWSKSENPTEIVKNYLDFWYRLPVYYQALQHQLQEKNEAYQGFAYKLAANKIQRYLHEHPENFYFLGFNALNQAEQTIVQSVLEAKKGTICWDLDQYFLEDKNHAAGKFIQQYQKEWSYYQQHTISPSTKEFSASKEIQLYSVSRSVGQAKAVGTILAEMSEEDLQETAIILADEALLLPVLNSLPENVKSLNITMGLPLKKTPLANFFEKIIKLHIRAEEKLFYKDVLQVIANPIIRGAFPQNYTALRNHLVDQNLIYISLKQLVEISEQTSETGFEHVLKLCFQTNENSPYELLNKLLELIDFLKPKIEKNILQLEYLFHFNKLFVKLSNLIQETHYIETIPAFFAIYRDTLESETLDFKGSPFQGLQLMGMLETRVLDFKNIIMTSVNEGTLPAGKSQNSFIPFDLKKHFQLPTYQEKDAIYAYHFFRLMQRAQKCFFLYNNDASGIEKAEKSRFLEQLKIFKNQQHQISEKVMMAPAKVQPKTLLEIQKTPAMIEKLKKRFQYKISPTALTTYIRNPIDFYKRYVLNIKENDEVEEEVSYRVHGNIIHDVLEKLYADFKGKKVTENDIDNFIKSYPDEIQVQFGKHFNQEAIKTGRNLLSYEIIKQQCKRFLEYEKQLVKSNELFILIIEENKSREFFLENLGFSIKLEGKADRIDQLNNTIRIVDYKSGKVETNQLKMKTDLSELTKDYKYSKAFQVLFYALLFEEEFDVSKVQSGIISFKNLSHQFMPFELDKNNSLSPDIMNAFKKQLFNLIEEILDPNHPFVEKEV